MVRTSVLCTLLLLLGVASGCDFPVGSGSDEKGDLPEPIVGERDSVRIEPGLEVTLSVPDTVAVADSFEVRVAVDNESGQEVSFRTPNSCLVRPAIYAEGDRVHMNGSLIGCAMVVTHRTVAAEETSTTVFEMQAVVREDEGEMPAEPGVYTAQVALDWIFGERRVEETLEVGFAVVPRDGSLTD